MFIFDIVEFELNQLPGKLEELLVPTEFGNVEHWLNDLMLAIIATNNTKQQTFVRGFFIMFDFMV